MKRKSDASDASRVQLTPAQRRAVEACRDFAALSAEQISAQAPGHIGADPLDVYTYALSMMRSHLNSTIDIIDELTGGAS
jgi:hypothetical protein